MLSFSTYMFISIWKMLLTSLKSRCFTLFTHYHFHPYTQKYKSSQGSNIKHLEHKHQNSFPSSLPQTTHIDSKPNQSKTHNHYSPKPLLSVKFWFHHYADNYVESTPSHQVPLLAVTSLRDPLSLRWSQLWCPWVRPPQVGNH